MSDDGARKQQVYFFNVLQHSELYEAATRDKVMAISYLHDHTSPDSKNGEKEGLWKYFNISGNIDTTYYIE